MTPENKELVERLKEPNGRGDHALGYHSLINPDGPAAATLITSLSSALEEAEGALRAVVKHCSNAGLPDDWQHPFAWGYHSNAYSAQFWRENGRLA